MPPPTPARIVRTALCLAFIFSAGFHVIALGFPEVSIPEPWWEHALFVAVNFSLAAAVITGVLPMRAELAVVVVFVAAQLLEHVVRLALQHVTSQDWMQNLGAIGFALVLLSVKLLELRYGADS